MKYQRTVNDYQNKIRDLSDSDWSRFFSLGALLLWVEKEPLRLEITVCENCIFRTEIESHANSLFGNNGYEWIICEMPLKEYDAMIKSCEKTKDLFK